MSRDACLPCFKCGKTLQNTCDDAENQPWEGTEFRTYGHYGSTFWDSFDGEELVLNVCDPCLREHSQRLGQQKRFLPIHCEGMTGFGRYWVDRPVVPYSGHPDTTVFKVDTPELGMTLPGVEWARDIQARKAALTN